MNNKFNIYKAPASCTEDSFAVLWDKPNGIDILAYNVYVNDKAYSSVKHTDYTVYGLESDTEYSVRVSVIDKEGNEVAYSNEIRIKTGKESQVINVNDFGAAGDGKTVDTKAIQRAIDECGEFGTVYVPKGKYISGALYLKSNMTLYIEQGAVIKGSPCCEDYPLHTYRWEGRERLCHASLINVGIDTDKNMENISIIGVGTIDANGEELKKNEQSMGQAERGRAVCIRNASNIYLKDITVRHSPAWCVHLICCENVSINNIKVYTRVDEYGNKYKDIVNGDGIDPDSCRNVYIFNSMIASQDDCIAIKSGRDEEGRRAGLRSDNIRITNCRFESGFGVAVGSEMSGGVSNVLVRDCVFRNTFSIGSIKTCRGRGGIIENILFEDVEIINCDDEFSDCEWFRGAIYIDCYYSLKEISQKEERVDEGTPLIRNVTFKNAVVDTCGGNAIYICGLPEKHLENITLENVIASGKYGMKAYYVDGLEMKNVIVSAREGEKFYGEEKKLYNIQKDD